MRAPAEVQGVEGAVEDAARVRPLRACSEGAVSAERPLVRASCAVDVSDAAPISHAYADRALKGLPGGMPRLNSQ